MRTKLLIAASAVAAFISTPSFAQDSSSQGTAAARSDTVGSDNFHGAYVAVSGGYDFQRNDNGSRLNFDRNGDGQFNEQVTTATGANAFSPGFCDGRARGVTLTAGGGCENDRNRESYYGRVGYDVSRGSFAGGTIVLGALGEFGRSNIKDYVTGFSTTPASYTFERGVDWEASGRLRAGYARGIGMFYATGGVGYARFKNRFSTSNTTNSFSTLLNDRDKFGFIVGGGVELRVMRRISLGMEYTYHDYKDGQYFIRATQGSAPATNPFVLAPYTAGTTIARSDPDFRWHSIRAVVGYHF